MKKTGSPFGLPVFTCLEVPGIHYGSYYKQI